MALFGSFRHGFEANQDFLRPGRHAEFLQDGEQEPAEPVRGLTAVEPVGGYAQVPARGPQEEAHPAHQGGPNALSGGQGHP